MSNYIQLTRQQKYDLLTTDFLDRDGDRFVRIRTTDRLGWESLLPEQTPYSAMILNPKSDRELYNNATRLARQMIISMDTPFRVSIHLSPSVSCTDSKSVYVATEVFDDKKLPLGQKLDTFLGLAIHEGCHLLYTDFKATEDNRNMIIHKIYNIIEDERIERELGEHKPGLANFLKAAKYYYFGRYEEEIKLLPQQPKYLIFFNTILSYIRYPAALIPDNVYEFADELLQVRDILTPYPESTAQCLEKAKLIYELLKKFMEQDQQQGGQSKDNDESQKEPNDGKPSSGESEEGQDSSGQSSRNGASAELTDEEILEKLKDVIEAMKIIAKEPHDPQDKTIPLSRSDMANALKKDKLIAMECEGQLEIGSQENTVLLKKEKNKYEYDKSLRRVRRYIPAVAQALRAKGTEYKYTVTGMRSGLLDTNKLCEARQGVQNVYFHKGEVKCDKINVALVVDESGSMTGVREQLARDTTVLINEAVGGLANVQLFIYGYNDSRDYNIIYPYREGRKPYDKYAIGSIGAKGCTPTDAAVLEAATRIRKQSKEKTLMFIISDGNANGGDESVRRSVVKARKMNFDIIGISISSALTEESLRKMYDHYIVMNDIDNLASDLGKTVKKAVLKNTKKTSSQPPTSKFVGSLGQLS